jgi:2,4-dienoyl-CoA reductase-like NADH-dependent reductase (Old Yellow Enzyme family)
MPTLFDPIQLGDIEAPNRIFMAPLTRGRSARDHVPRAFMADYYSQRASAGLIISEATGISREGLGWPYAPGLWSNEQVEAWKPITEKVHAKGGRIFAQLWHMGRTVHPSFLDGAQPVSSSATTAPYRAHTYDGRQLYAEARALDRNEIPRVIADYVHAARNARAAGFDGVQIHGANGYLIDQFLRDGANFRTDDYGGSVENRIRLMREVVGAIAGEIGAGRTAIRLSPNGDSQGVIDSDPSPLFAEAAKALDSIGIAFIELREPGPHGTFGSTEQPKQSPIIRQSFRGKLVLNSDYIAADAEADIASGQCDAISFGRPFISNPDLPRRIAINAPLAENDMSQWYGQDEIGYSDWPDYAEA